MRTPMRPCLALLVFLSMTSCGGNETPTSPVPPDPGPVSLLLTTPNSDDGIILLSIAGGSVSSAQSTGFELQTTPAGTAPFRMLVRGALTNGVIATVALPDRRVISSYSVTVQQVAARATYVQRAPQSYRVQLVRP